VLPRPRKEFIAALDSPLTETLQPHCTEAVRSCVFI
jgi:hypothetical protein